MKKRGLLLLFSSFLLIFVVSLFVLGFYKTKSVFGVVGTLNIEGTTGTLNLPGGIWDSGGNVGIGTTAPTQKFQTEKNIDGEFVGLNIANPQYVSSSVNETVSIVGQLGKTGVNPYMDAGKITIGKEADFSSGANADSFMAFSTLLNGAGSVTERMRITSAGNVGIGTTIPASQLSVGGAGSAGYGIYGTGTNGIRGVGTATGVYGVGDTGVIGYGDSYGVWGATSTSNGFGFYAGDSNGKSYFAGNVGIGTTAPSRKLDIVGTITASGAYYSGATIGLSCSTSAPSRATLGIVTSCAVSSLKYKTNIFDLNLGLDAVMKLRPVTFDWKNTYSGYEPGRQFGFIAEEVEQVNSLFVDHNPDGTPEGVKYEQLTSLLAKAIQEQQGEIASLTGQLANLSLNDAGDLIIIGDTPDTYAVVSPTGTVISKISAFAEVIAAKVKAGIIETKQLVVDGVDVFKKLTELSNKVDAQQKQIDYLKKTIEELKNK